MNTIEELLNNLPEEYISHYSPSVESTTIFIMRKDGKAVCKLSWWDNDLTTIYLDWLSIDNSIKRQGIGTYLQELREDIGRKLGATTAFLQVRKDTWMRDWYKRRGYVDYIDSATDSKFIWMKKELNSGIEIA